MANHDVPEPWATAMIEKGFTHGGKPSYRALAREARIGSAETVRRAVLGMRTPDVETVDAMADALGIDRVTVGSWIGDSREMRRPYRTPSEVALLTRDEQRAINDLIRAIAKTRRGGGADDEGDEPPAPTPIRPTPTPAGPSDGYVIPEEDELEDLGRAARKPGRGQKGNPAVDEANRRTEEGDSVPRDDPGDR